MVKYDFDSVIDRQNTNCAKWDTMKQIYKRDNLIYLGVADMDFRSPKPIIDGFEKCIKHGVFGYTDLNDEFYSSIQSWMKRMHSVDTSVEEIVFCPRINISSSLCVETFTKPGDEILINTPAYGPLFDAIAKNGRTVLKSPLKRTGTRYTFDFDLLEKQVSPKTKMFILCSPHNPVGRVWTKEELEQIGQFCVKHDLLLFVDEIHSDIIAKGTHFISSLSLSEEVRQRLITATSLTKTFNIPGLILSYMIIPNEAIRSRVRADIDRIGMHNPNIFSVDAVNNAYTKCDDWYHAMLEYIDENESFTRDYFAKHMPAFEIYPREGTYLLWMNYEALHVTEEELEKWFLDEAGVSVYMGTVFQEEGRGFIRVNIASPRSLLKEAFDRMSNAYSKLAK